MLQEEPVGLMLLDGVNPKHQQRARQKLAHVRLPFSKVLGCLSSQGARGCRTTSSCSLRMAPACVGRCSRSAVTKFVPLLKHGSKRWSSSEQDVLQRAVCPSDMASLHVKPALLLLNMQGWAWRRLSAACRAGMRPR